MARQNYEFTSESVSEGHPTRFATAFLMKLLICSSVKAQKPASILIKFVSPAKL